MSSTATTKFRPTANPEFNRAMQLIGRSSATQKHDSRPNRQRSRHAAKRAAIKGGW